MTVEVYDHAGRLLEVANEDRQKRLARAPNAEIVRKRNGKVVQINLKNFCDDTDLVVHRGNPRRYTHDHETEVNPPRVWTMRRIPSHCREIFQASVLDNLQKAA